MKECKTKHCKEVMDLYRLLRKAIFLTLVTLFTIVTVTLAWLANNNAVSGDGLNILGSNQSGFELMTEGTDMDPELKQYLTDNSILCWKLSEESNLNNYGSNSEGVAPGSSGNLVFYVIPNLDGSLNINFTLDILPIKKDESLDSDTMTKVEKFLRGHLLFACKYTIGETEKRALVDVKGGNFSIELPNDTKAGQKQEVVLEWFWPYTLNEANNYYVYGNGISDMTSNQEYSDYFFYNKTGNVNISSDFGKLNFYYNEADQMIGDKAKAIAIIITADLAS